MTPDTEVLRGLLAKVEGASGPSRKLDAETCQGLGIAPWTGWWRTQSTAFVQGSNLDRETPKLTASIDAALALAERVLPEWSHESGRSGFGNPAWCRLWNPMKSPGESNTFRFDNDAGSEPLAILGALLTAALAQGGQHGA